MNLQSVPYEAVLLCLVTSGVVSYFQTQTVLCVTHVHS